MYSRSRLQDIRERIEEPTNLTIAGEGLQKLCRELLLEIERLGEIIDAVVEVRRSREHDAVIAEFATQREMMDRLLSRWEGEGNDGEQ